MPEEMIEVSPDKVGNIPESWEVKELQGIAKVVDSCHKTPKYSTHGIAMVRVTDIKEGYLNLKETLKVTKEVYDEFTKNHVPQIDDIVMSRVGTYGVTSFVKIAKPFCLGQNTVVIHSKSNSKFLYYMLRSSFVKRQIEERVVGSTQKTISLKDIRELRIPFPPPFEREMIGQILSYFDEKTELNQQMNITLEAIGRAIFKNWFVDFEFPNEEGKPYKSSGGEMVNDLDWGREIPKGWKVKKLGAFIDLDRGLSYKGAGLSDQGLPMINLGTISPKAGFIPEGMKYYAGDYKEKQLVEPGDVVIANTDITQKREVLGSPAIVPPNLNCRRALFTHHIFAVRNKSSLPNLFIYYLLQMKEYRDRAMGFATGTTVLALPKDAVLDFTFVLPDNRTLRLFEEVANSLAKKTDANVAQNTTLISTRDVLLPRFMSGKVRVPVPQDAVET